MKSLILFILLTLFAFFINIHSSCYAETVAEIIQQAGNADDEKTRLNHLSRLLVRSDLPEGVRSEILPFLDEVKRWNEDPDLDYFGRTIREKLDWDFHVAQDSPLYALTHLYRARMLIWYTLEHGGVWNNEENRERFLFKAKKNLLKAKERFPDNPIVRMYLGEPILSPIEYQAPPSAPEWAKYQREGLERLADIIEWWIDNRMQPNGEYGGGWGDDCEMWRWWVPVLIAFDDPKITAAQTRFSQALLSQPHLEPGYMTRMTDVEHSAEDLADTLTPMMHLDPDNPNWQAKVNRLMELAMTLWTAENDKGQLQFKSTYFTATEVSNDPQKACDTVYHPRALQPVLLYWQRTGDERITAFMKEWMNTWTAASLSTDRGKPKGIIPSAIHFPDGTVGGLNPPWYDPRNHGESTLYQWPSAMNLMANTMLLTHYMTRDDRYLKPLRMMADHRWNYLQRKDERKSFEEGSAMWCASQLNLTGVWSKYDRITGKDDFRYLLREENDPYTRYALKLERSLRGVVNALKKNAQALGTNVPGYTSEVRYTDRVIRFPSLFARAPEMNPRNNAIPQPDPMLLYSTATADPGDPGYFPINRVRWLTPPRGIAALVTHADDKRLEAKLFHFGGEDRSMRAELYLFEPGAYRWEIASRVSNTEWNVYKQGEVEVDSLRTRISFVLKPNQEAKFQFYR